MKKLCSLRTSILLAGAFSASLSFNAHADMLMTIGAKANVWNATPGGQIDNGIELNKKANGLGLDSTNGINVSVFVEHPVPVLPNVRLSSTTLSMDGKGTFSAKFAGKTFSSQVNSQLDLSHQDITLYWGLPLPVPYLDINFGLNTRLFNGSASAENQVSGKKATKLEFPLPMLYGGVKVGSPFGLYADADINWIGIDEKNKISDMSLAVGYELPIPVADLGVELGYRAMNLTTDKADDVAPDIKVDGLFFGVSLSVGL